MTFEFNTWIGTDPPPREQLEAIRHYYKTRGDFRVAAMTDLLTCVIGLYDKIDGLQTTVDKQADLIAMLQGFRKVKRKDVKTTTIEAATIPGDDVIRVPGARG